MLCINELSYCSRNPCERSSYSPHLCLPRTRRSNNLSSVPNNLSTLKPESEYGQSMAAARRASLRQWSFPGTGKTGFQLWRCAKLSRTNHCSMGHEAAFLPGILGKSREWRETGQEKRKTLLPLSALAGLICILGFGFLFVCFFLQCQG